MKAKIALALVLLVAIGILAVGPVVAEEGWWQIEGGYGYGYSD